jgi:hypothetical protein
LDESAINNQSVGTGNDYDIEFPPIRSCLPRAIDRPKTNKLSLDKRTQQRQTGEGEVENLIQELLRGIEEQREKSEDIISNNNISRNSVSELGTSEVPHSFATEEHEGAQSAFSIEDTNENARINALLQQVNKYIIMCRETQQENSSDGEEVNAEGMEENNILDLQSELDLDILFGGENDALLDDECMDTTEPMQVEKLATPASVFCPPTIKIASKENCFKLNNSIKGENDRGTELKKRDC